MRDIISRLFDNPNKIETIHNEWWKEGVATHSPDMVDLFKYKYLRIFVCDELMKAHAEHHLLGQKYPFSWHSITHSKFSMVKFEDKAGEMCIPLKFRLADAPWCPIRGELYGITPHQLIQLDKIRMNGVQFQRHRINLRIPLRRLATEYWAKDRDMFLKAVEKSPYEERNVRAWMYVGVPHFWNDILTYTWDDKDGLKYLKQTFRWKEGQLMPVIKNSLFRPVKSYTPNNKLLEDYYFNSRYEPAITGGRRVELPEPDSSFNEFAVLNYDDAIAFDDGDDQQQAA